MSSTATATITQTSPADLPAPPPAHCPGPESDQAGTAPNCAGCPNQTICATAPKGPDPDLPLIARNIEGIRHKVLVLSGKGGVGKSTFSAMLGQGLALEVDSATGEELNVGILDLDITGPSLPLLLGVPDEKVHASSTGLSPVYLRDNLCTISIQFLLPARDAAVIWRGAKKSGMVKRFLRDVDWAATEWLVVDTPPGTSDEHLSVNAALKDAGGVTGAVLVTTPQEVSLLDVRKEADFCRKANIRILGIVENMSTFICPHCDKGSDIFKATTGGAEGLAKELGVEFLGRIPLDPRVGVAGEFGESAYEVYPDSPAVEEMKKVVERVRRIVEGKE